MALLLQALTFQVPFRLVDLYLMPWEKSWWKPELVLGHWDQGGKGQGGGHGGGRADGDERELLEELLPRHVLRAARRLRGLELDPLQVLDVLALDARLLLEEGGGAEKEAVGRVRGAQVGRGHHAQGRRRPWVHPRV